ncbi:glycosyltransferase 61 family protein [Methylocapsa sp. D3K7]|uniref:glycosyltransferase family 61 protein n=1 Tax=Methylocapsa sp. D3K7 TaxID=3041435 RepID=UPI00244E5E12|nr:glycosyltransferase 61 family protein [Methylocapsa sp. D3K7]WGJ14344.1 glycosyltransferase 61 family protein [Methylocapsa sp. D3K7]
MNWAWRIGDFPERKVEIIKLRDVFVSGEGLVFNHDLNVFHRTITQQIPDHIEQARIALKTAIASGNLKEIDGPAVLCVKPGWGNYGHWLIEMLPKVSVAAQLLPDANLKFIVPGTTGLMNDVIEDSLALIGIDIERLIKYTPSPMRVRELILVDGLTAHGSYMSPLVFGPLDWIASQVQPGESQRIYIRRKIPAYRQFVNEDEVCEVLARKGFTIVSPEEHCFRDQVSFFKGAKQILGITSAALTSLCFCGPGTNVTMFYPSVMPDTFYWFIAEHRKLKFKDIRCELGGAPKTHNAWDGALKISPDELLELIEASAR